MVQHAGYRPFAFIDPVHDALISLNPLVDKCNTLRSVVEQQGWEIALNHPLYGHEISRLVNAQSRALRNLYGPNALTRLAEESLRENGPVNAHTRAVFTDVKLVEEARWIDSMGGIVILVVNDESAPAGPLHDEAHLVFKNDENLIERIIDSVS